MKTAIGQFALVALAWPRLVARRRWRLARVPEDLGTVRPTLACRLVDRVDSGPGEPEAAAAFRPAALRRIRSFFVTFFSTSSARPQAG